MTESIVESDAVDAPEATDAPAAPEAVEVEVTVPVTPPVKAPRSLPRTERPIQTVGRRKEAIVRVRIIPHQPRAG